MRSGKKENIVAKQQCQQRNAHFTHTHTHNHTQHMCTHAHTPHRFSLERETPSSNSLESYKQMRVNFA